MLVLKVLFLRGSEEVAMSLLLRPSPHTIILKKNIWPTVEQVAVHEPIAQLQAERVPKRANDSVAMEVGGAWKRICTSTHSGENQWVTQSVAKNPICVSQQRYK